MTFITRQQFVAAGFVPQDMPEKNGYVRLYKKLSVSDINLDYLQAQDGHETYKPTDRVTLVTNEDGEFDLYIAADEAHVQWGISPGTLEGQRLLLNAMVLVTKGLVPGDDVYWFDPDNGISSGKWVITDVCSESGAIDDLNTEVWLSNEEGSECQALARELARYYAPEDLSDQVLVLTEEGRVIRASESSGEVRVIRPDGKVIQADENGGFALYEKVERS